MAKIYPNPRAGAPGVNPVLTPSFDGVRPGSAPSPLRPLTVKGQATAHVAGLPVGTVNVVALQQFLRSKGYDIKVDGQLGQQTRAAVASFGIGKVPAKVAAQSALGAALKGTTRPPDGLTPEQFNQQYGTPATKAKAYKSNNTLLDPQGNTVPQQSDAPPVDLRALNAIAAQQGQIIPQSLADQLAQNAAGSQFDPQIHDAQVQIAQAPQQARQNQADIANWYGQVQGAQKTAAGRDTAISGAGVNSMRQALAAIISSIGGSANEGSASVGAAGANDIGTLQALGGIQDQYNADLTPLLKLAQSGAATGQQAKDQLALTTLNQHLADLQGQRGQTAAATKADQLMKIIQANNATGQQNFQNKLNVSAAAEAAQLQGLKVLTAQQKAAAYQPRGGITAATPTEIQSVQNAVLKHILDANGNPLPGMTPTKAAAIAKTVGSTFFPSTGVSSGWAQSVVSPFFSTP